MPSLPPPTHGQAPGPWRRVTWEGEVDLAVAPAMRDRAIQAGQSGCCVIVDLAGVSFMDAAGIGAIVEARFRLRSIGGDLLVRNPSPRVTWLLTRFDLAELVELSPEGFEDGPRSPP